MMLAVVVKRRIVEVVEYRPEWKASFENERTLLERALAGLVVEIFHVGSTSVPDLAAKPIIDMIIEVTDLGILDKSEAKLSELGYVAKGENGISGRRYFQKGGVERSHHLHAYQAGDHNVRRHIMFRDYLIANPPVAKSYAELKREVAALYKDDTALYQAAKDDFISRYELLAAEWFQSRVL